MMNGVLTWCYLEGKQPSTVGKPWGNNSNEYMITWIGNSSVNKPQSDCKIVREDNYYCTQTLLAEQLQVSVSRQL